MPELKRVEDLEERLERNNNHLSFIHGKRERVVSCSLRGVGGVKNWDSLSLTKKTHTWRDLGQARRGRASEVTAASQG